MRAFKVTILVILLITSALICILSFYKDASGVNKNVQYSVSVEELIDKIKEEEDTSKNVNKVFDIAVGLDEALVSISSDLVVAVYLARVAGVLSFFAALSSLYFLGSVDKFKGTNHTVSDK